LEGLEQQAELEGAGFFFFFFLGSLSMIGDLCLPLLALGPGHVHLIKEFITQ
jgi:hypothetical protein